MKRCVQLNIIRIIVLTILFLGIVVIEGFLPIRVKGKAYVKTFVIDPDKEFMYTYNYNYSKGSQEPLNIDKLSKIDDLGGYYENIGWFDDDAIGIIKRNSPKQFENSQQVSLPYWQINVMNIETRGCITLVPNPVKSQQMAIISPDKRKIAFTEGEEDLSGKGNADTKLVIYDIYTKSKETIAYFSPVVWSNDSRYIIGYYVNMGVCSLVSYDSVTNNRFEISLDRTKFINISNMVISKDNHTLYFASNTDANYTNYNVYKISMKNGEFSKSEPQIAMKNQVTYFDLIDSGNIIFLGEVNGSKGIYITKNNGLSSSKIADNENEFFVMSPDKKCIAFCSSCSSGGTNLYAAKLNNDNIYAPTLVYKFSSH